MAEVIPSVNIDTTPNLGAKSSIVRADPVADGDTIDMGSYGYTTVYAAIALVANVSEPVAISSDTLLTFGAGGGAAVTVIVYGV